MSLFPVVAVERVEPSEANRWLVDWCHPLGACRRPFHQEAHVMLLDGRPVAATVSASTVSATCAGFDRGQVVELARIGRSPDEPWTLRPLLRIWRAAIAPTWSAWPVVAAVSYAMPGKVGDIYRFDGWERVGMMRASGGGGTWSNRPASAARGDKILWRWVYP